MLKSWFSLLKTSFLGCLCLFATQISISTAADELTVDVLYIEQKIERPPVLSNLVVWPEDDGERGAALGTNDNNTTGRFLGQTHQLTTQVVDIGEDVVEVARNALANKSRLVVLNVEAETLLEIADLPEASDDLLFNARSRNTSLRDSDCRGNLLHTAPSRSMLSDALMQFLNKRKWRELFLIEGNRSGDTALANAMRRSAKKFQLKIVEDKQWIEDADMRRNATQEVPVFTQARKYDAVVVTDEDRDFAQYLLYNTWLPRPVAGSAGMRPVAWSPVIEQWGAAQLQSRFMKLSARQMTEVDYGNWAAVRSIGEAVTRIKSTVPMDVRDYLLSSDFELAGFKGTSLSFRPWNGQLRQSVQLVHANAVVASAPIEGFLHARTELDTLGLDKPESQCSAFN